MLWLTSILCIAGVGAASIVALPAGQDTADTEDDPDTDDLLPNERHIDLLENLDTADVADAHLLDVDIDVGLPSPNVLNTADADLSPQGLSDITQIGDGPAISENVTNSGAPHGLSLLGHSVADDDDYWALDQTGENAGIYPMPDIVTEAHVPVALGDWITEGEPAEILDYQRGEESLMLVWDDLENDPHEPEVAVESDPFDDEVKHILMNGKSVAEVYGDPDMTAADVTVIPLSSALIVGLEPTETAA